MKRERIYQGLQPNTTNIPYLSVYVSVKTRKNMEKNEDLRWEQRFSNFLKAFGKLDEAVNKIKSDYGIDTNGNIDEDSFLDDIIKEGLIQRFEYTHEWAWNG